jgi:hypothetical protein
MTDKLLQELMNEVERVKKEFQLQEAEFLLLRDWRDTCQDSG